MDSVDLVRERRTGASWIAMGRMGLIGVIALGALGALGLGCSDDSVSDGTRAASSDPSQATPPSQSSPTSPKTSPAAPVAETRTHQELVNAGRGVYMGNCIACHNIDATKDGTLGPAVAGATLDLLEARVLRSEYPVGYKPKRDTRVMIALRHLEPNLAELEAYLNSLE